MIDLSVLQIIGAVGALVMMLAGAGLLGWVCSNPVRRGGGDDGTVVIKIVVG